MENIAIISKVAIKEPAPGYAQKLNNAEDVLADILEPGILGQ